MSRGFVSANEAHRDSTSACRTATLYGVGNGGGVYTIDPITGQATFVNALTVPLTGMVFGVDLNPAADRRAPFSA